MNREMRAVFRVLSDPRRFQILRHIAAGDRTPCVDLRAAFPITAATLSHHLKELEAAGLIETERQGKFVYVTFCRDRWDRYLDELRTL